MENHITMELEDLSQAGGARAFSDQGIQVDMVDEESEENHDVPGSGLIYGVLDTPPIHITIICGLQVSIEFLSNCIVFRNDSKKNTSQTFTIIKNLFGFFQPSKQRDHVEPINMLATMISGHTFQRRFT